MSTRTPQGIARLPNNMLVFVQSLLPGETAMVRQVSTTAGYANAIKLQQLRPPTDAVPAPCPHVNACGGCHVQQVSYTQQLRLKHALVVDALSRIGKLSNAADIVAPVVPSAQQLHYRNNMQFAWDASRGVLGLRPPGTNTDIVALEDACLLQPDIANALLRACARLLRAHPVAAAVVERVTIRSAAPKPDTLQFVVGFSTVGQDGTGVRAELDACAAALHQDFGDVLTGVVWTHRPRGGPIMSPRAKARRQQLQKAATNSVLYGTSILHESRVGSCQLDIAFDSFFQVNTLQADTLFAIVRRIAGLQSTDTVLDLFCGAGAIGLSLADLVEQVVGIDIDRTAIQAAQDSAATNNVTNASFYAADLAAVPSILEKSQTPVDVVVVDPPRAGLHESLAQWLCTSPILAKATRSVVYVSCNAATLARDIGRLGGRWRVQTIVPVDMFPQTAHVEVVALLVLL